MTNRIRPIVWIEIPPMVAFTASQRMSPKAMRAMGGPASTMVASPCVGVGPRIPHRRAGETAPGRTSDPAGLVLQADLVEPVRDVGGRAAVELRANREPQDVVRVVGDLVAAVREVDD